MATIHLIVAGFVGIAWALSALPQWLLLVAVVEFMFAIVAWAVR